MYAYDLVLISSSLMLLQKMNKIRYVKLELAILIWFSMHPSPCYCVLVVAITDHVLMLALAVMLFQQDKISWCLYLCLKIKGLQVLQ